MNMEKQAICLLVMCMFGLIICDEGKTNTTHLHHYDGSGAVKIQCSGSNVINVTDIQLSNHPKDCFRDTCNLRNNDVNHIESCNGKSSCQIPVDEMSPCIKDKGFYSVDYSCQKNVYYDFEDESYKWFLEENNWTIVDAKNQYPYRDHTTGSGLGHYMFVEPAGSFKSLTIHGGFKQCLTFYYYIRHGDDSIMLYIQDINGTSTQECVINRHADSNMWNRQRLSIKYVAVYRIFIEGRAKYKWSAFAVDDISIINRDCEEIRECDFEYGECDWTRSYRWYIEHGETDSDYTGPSTDHTTTDNGYYVYMEASGMRNGQKKNLTSPIYSGTGEMCFAFWYYMYGHQMGSLTVYIVSKSTDAELFHISGNKGELWHAGAIDINVYGEFVIIIQGQRGSGSKSDIAIDDISLFPGNCKGIVQHQQSCTPVNKQVELRECSQHYVSNIHVNVDPKKEFCRKFYDENTNSVCNNSSYNVLCDVENVARERPSCFSLNDLMIEYTCTEVSNMKSNDKDSTGVAVGVVIGLLLVVGVIVGVVYLIHRRRKIEETAQNKNSTAEYSNSWHLNSQGSTSNSSDPHANHTKYIQPSNNGLAINHSSNNPSYGQDYIINTNNEPKNDQDTEYMNITARNGNLIPHNVDEEYKVLDPAANGYNRRNPDTYELASPVNKNQDDNYAVTGAGVYDISGNNRHKMKDTIYDHTVDDTYDTSNRGRQEYLGDYTYNHVFGKQTEDEYDIAGS